MQCGSPTSASARLLDSARAIALDSSSQARPSRSPACAAAAPRAPNPDLALTQKAAQMENGITNSSISRRARRAAALGLNPSAALSPPRLRHRCAPRAPVRPGPDPEGGPGRENGITDSSCSRRARRAAALGLSPSAALSPLRLRRRRAPRAQL